MIELTRHQDDIRSSIEAAQWEEARQEWVAALALRVAGGEQPAQAIDSPAGALRGGFPLSETVKENK